LGAAHGLDVQTNARIPPAEAPPGTRPIFRALVVYEDVAAKTRAFLIAQPGDAVECRTSMWKFDLMRSAKLRKIAAMDAVGGRDRHRGAGSG
jgi:hypothetical protein